MAKQSGAQKATVERVMHEFKRGELDSSGGKVRDPKQAIAIALSEAGESNQQSPQENRQRLAETKRKERTGETEQARRESGPSRAELYREATRKGIAGRSRMDKAGLQKALAAAG